MKEKLFEGRFGLWAVAVVAVVCAQPAAAQVSWDRYQVGAIATEQAPVLDGILDDAVWSSAALIDEFIQQEPDEGAPSSERTEVRVLYDAETLYLGVRALDSGDGVTATEMRRDSDRILEEDNFQIILDTFKDSRSAYMFVTNPLGAQLDQQISNEGEGGRPGRPASSINRDWDGVWHVSARTTSDGWIAEIAIPMVTLRFPDADRQSWGLNLMRNIGRKNEQAFWAPIPQAYTLTRVSLAGSLNGMQSLSRGMDLRVTPFVTSGSSRVLDAGTEADSWERDVGVDLKYGITSGLNLDLTVNTDFAQAEVDDEQVNLTRFPLFFPEKRDFFLENSGNFNVSSAQGFARLADLFFSRRIGIAENGESVPILGGARLTGKIGRNDIALMDVQTDEAYGLSGENFLVARYSRNILARSRVGGMFINRVETDGDGFNRTYAADVSLAPHPSLSVVSFLAKTETPGVTGGETGSYLNAEWLDQNWRIFGEFADFDDDFNPEVGFLPRRGIMTTKIHFERTPRPERWGIRMLSPMMNWTYTTDQTGLQLSRRMHFMMGTRFDNGAYMMMWYNDHFERLVDDFTLRGVTIDSGDYKFGEWRFSFDSNPARRFYYGLIYSPQTFFDGTRTDGTVKVGARITDRLSTEGQYARNDVSLVNGGFVVDLASLRVDLALSATMTLRSVTQYNSFTDQFGTSARFRWTYRPGSDVYVVYDEVRRDPQTLFEFRDRRLILKATYLFSG